MLEVRIDLVPFGDRSRVKEIGYAKIWNDTTGDVEVGNYGYIVEDGRGQLVAEGKYKGHKRGNSVFHLLRDILNQELID
ncbi:MAG: hypothetical protein DRQ47_08465 [Gammaproteobacteria bacterium]|nr:MAG: hypothetical protein DRQ47_08465 [Gammaproteobacteria bacterium]